MRVPVSRPRPCSLVLLAAKGGSDGGTAAQLSACSGIQHRLRGARKDLSSQGTNEVAQAIN
jgi:hypothetical protein